MDGVMGFSGVLIREKTLLTLKDAYYEEQMGYLIDSMLMQVHVLGRGVIGQVAFTQNHYWIFSSDTHQQRQNHLAPYKNLEDESDFDSHFCMGIQTIALISVEPWGVVQFGSTHKIPETKDIVDQVKKLFEQARFLEGDQILDSTIQFCSLTSCSISSSPLIPSQSFPSTSTYPFEDCLLESGSSNFYDCPTTPPLINSSNYSVLTSEPDQNMSGDYESQELYKNMLNTKSFISSICKSQRPSGLLTMEELSQENDFAKYISNPGLDDDFCWWLSPQSGLNSTTSSTSLLNSDLSHSTTPVHLSNLCGNNSPIQMSENLPTNSMKRSLTEDAFRSSNPQKMFDTWDETLIPVKNHTPNSLFSRLGIDHLLDDCGFTGTGCKRKRTDGFSSSHNQVKNETIFSFDGRLKSLNPLIEPTTMNIGVHSEASTRETGSCIGDSTSSSDRQDEPAKTAKKLKAKAGTGPRPKDRQMIQDRLTELRELVPSGEKMSIDRLLERTIQHLRFMQSLIKHTESLKQTDKTKRMEVMKNHSTKDSGGVTWACEVGKSMVCPLIVEDLITPGQILIEMLSEEHGFFLEIADIIRGFGLTILKGVTEVREPNMIWAHFLVQVEGTRPLTRHDIFSSLIKLLQMSGQSATDGFGNGISSSKPSFNKRQSNRISFRVNSSDALQCANL
ncbi:hypothetical protein OROGR_013145 [Orobanche gracilis]